MDAKKEDWIKNTELLIWIKIIYMEVYIFIWLYLIIIDGVNLWQERKIKTQYK